MDVKIASEAMRITLYRLKCETLVETWHSLLDYSDLDAWFTSNRCCLPIALSRLLDKRILKDMSS